MLLHCAARVGPTGRVRVLGQGGAFAGGGGEEAAGGGNGRGNGMMRLWYGVRGQRMLP